MPKPFTWARKFRSALEKRNLCTGGARQVYHWLVLAPCRRSLGSFIWGAILISSAACSAPKNDDESPVPETSVGLTDSPGAGQSSGTATSTLGAVPPRAATAAPLPQASTREAESEPQATNSVPAVPTPEPATTSTAVTTGSVSATIAGMGESPAATSDEGEPTELGNTSDGAGGAPSVMADAGPGGAAGSAGMAGTQDEPDFRSLGCDANGASLAEGPHSFELDGRNRRYTVRLPSNYDASRPWPLVLALHPNGGDVGYWDGTTGSRNVRGYLSNEAVIIIAEAIGGNWRDYDAPEAEWPGRVDLELSYFDRVIDDAKQQLCIDERSVFAMGFSGGGSFSGVLGCRRTDIRAFAAGGSVIYFDPEKCVGNAAAWIVLSEEDDTEDRRAYLDFFAERNDCQPARFEEPTCHEYTGCAEGSPVVFCHYPGGHDWPSFGTEDAWTFFSRFIEI